METNSTGGQGSRRAVAPSDYDDGEYCRCELFLHGVDATISYVYFVIDKHASFVFLLDIVRSRMK